MAAELIVYTDESKSSNHRYSNFYGGALVRSTDLERVDTVLRDVVATVGLTSELKWTNITTSVADRYIHVMETFFDLITEDAVKVRVMFTQTRVKPANLTDEQRANRYWILYYQFLKHAFGFGYVDEFPDGVVIRLMIDEMPGTLRQRSDFKAFILGLNHQSPISHSQVKFVHDRIIEVDSRRHITLQCLDVVLGSMHFRLNNLHQAKPAGKHRRGARTRAKEQVYKAIQARLKTLRPHFNIGVSTGWDDDQANLWRHSYRHWLFRPKTREGETRS